MFSKLTWPGVLLNLFSTRTPTDYITSFCLNVFFFVFRSLYVWWRYLPYAAALHPCLWIHLQKAPLSTVWSTTVTILERRDPEKLSRRCFPKNWICSALWVAHRPVNPSEFRTPVTVLSSYLWWGYAGRRVLLCTHWLSVIEPFAFLFVL